MPVFVVLLNWNQVQLLVDCLASLATVPAPHRIVVVDNGSTEPVDWEALSEGGRRFHFIQSGGNCGFAGGNNLGIQFALDAGAEQILLLNTDTRVESDFLDVLLAAAREHPGAGAFGATIRFDDRREMIWFEGGALDEREAKPVHQPFARVAPEPLTGPPRPTYFVTGCCFLASAESWRRVGLLSEDFFFRWEDTDWCERARALGLTHWYVPGAVVYHRTALRPRWIDGSPAVVYYETRNRLLYVSRHVRPTARRHAYWRALRSDLRILVDLCGATVTGRGKRLRALFSGVADFLRGRSGRGPDWLS